MRFGVLISEAAATWVKWGSAYFAAMGWFVGDVASLVEIECGVWF